MPPQMPTRPAAAGQSLERPRYFARQMITPDDLTQGLEYLRERLRRHNRALHGYGVVYGALVVPVFDPIDGAVRKVQVTPGLALTPPGDEVEITAIQTFDTTREPTPGATQGADDPWYSDVFIDRRDAPIKYLAVRYAELPTHPVRVGPSACDCGGSVSCENSRIRDCFSIELLDNLPPSHVGGTSVNIRVHQAIDALGHTGGDPIAAIISNVFSGSLPPAPTASVTDPWVVLATLHFNAGVVVAIDQIADRRLVASNAPLWWRPITELSITGVNAVAVADTKDPKIADLTLTVTGKGLLSIRKQNVHFEKDGDKIQIDKVTPDPANPDTKLTITGSFAAGPTPPKPIHLQIVRSDGVWATSPDPAIVIPNVPTPTATPLGSAPAPAN